MRTRDRRYDLGGAGLGTLMLGREAGTNLLGLKAPRQIKTSQGDQQRERQAMSEAREDLRAG